MAASLQLFMNKGALWFMKEKRQPPETSQAEELIKAFDRERSAAHDLNRRYEDTARESRRRDRQVLIERRRSPR
jgi:hypothetical protein